MARTILGRLARTAFTVACLQTAVGLNATARAAGEHLSFDQAIERATAGSLKSRLAGAELDQQIAKRRQAQSGYGPHVEAGYNNVHFDKEIRGALGPAQFLVRDSRSQTGYIGVVQPITGIFAAYEKTNLEKTQEKINEAGLEAARIDSAFTAAVAYRRAQEAIEIERITEASTNATESQARDARLMVQSGRLIKSDLLKIEIAKQEAKSAVAKAHAGRKKAFASLAFALGSSSVDSPTLDPLATPANLRKALSTSTAMVLNQNDMGRALSKAEDTRLDVKQAVLTKEKAHYAHRLVDYRFVPRVNAIARWDKDYGKPPFGTEPFNRTLGFNAVWDLWDNGSRIFAEQEVSAQAQQADAGLEIVKDKLRLELASILADLQAASESLAASEASVTQAEDAYRLDKARFTSGLVTATDLVLAETLQTRARGSLVTAMTEVDVLQLMTQKALGETRPHAILP